MSISIRKSVYKLSLAFFILIPGACQLTQLKSPAGKQIILADTTQNCTPGESQRLYFLLFGGYQLSDLDEDRLFGNAKAIQINHSMDWIDYLITLGGGYAVTLNSYTVSVLNCSSNLIVVDPKSEQSRIDSILAKYASNESARGNHPIVVLKDGTDVSGKIIEMNSELLVLEIVSESQSGPSHKIYLKNGTVISGRVVGHTRNSVKLDTSNGIRRIKKSEINRIDMNAVPEPLVEKKEIKRSLIKTILLQENGPVEKPQKEDPSESDRATSDK